MKWFFRQGSVLSILILINISVWALIQVARVLSFLYNNPDASIVINWVYQSLAVPASFHELMTKPWTLFTYMFLHVDIWHILFNMLWLYWFGKIFLEYLNSRQLLTVYSVGGLFGGIVYIAAFNFFPVFQGMVVKSYALGASASVMAVVTSIAFIVPNYTIHLLFFGRVRIVYLAIILFIFDFFMIPSGNPGGHIAHIGGALFGFLFSFAYRKGFFLSSGDSQFSLFNAFRSPFQKKKSYSTKNPENTRRPVSDEEYNSQKIDHQKRIDHILDKISKGGYDSLTKEEKEFLFKSSTKR